MADGEDGGLPSCNDMDGGLPSCNDLDLSLLGGIASSRMSDATQRNQDTKNTMCGSQEHDDQPAEGNYVNAHVEARAGGGRRIAQHEKQHTQPLRLPATPTSASIKSHASNGVPGFVCKLCHIAFGSAQALGSHRSQSKEHRERLHQLSADEKHTYLQAGKYQRRDSHWGVIVVDD